MKRMPRALTAFALLVALAACSPNDSRTPEAAAGDTIRVDVVAVLPLTGGLSSIGIPKRQAMELVAAEARSLAPPVDFRFRYQDSQGTPTQGLSAFLQAATDAEAAFIDLTTVVGAASATLSEHPRIATFAGSAQAGITDSVPNLFRVFPGGDQEVALLGEYVRSQGVATLYVLHTNELYGRSISRLVASRAAEWGTQLVGDDEYGLGDTDFRSQLTRARDSGAQKILIMGYGTEYGTLLSQAQELGIRPDAFLSNLGAVNATVVALPSALTEGLVFAGPTIAIDMADSTLSAGASDFVRRYQAQFGATPDFRVAFVFDAFMMLAKAYQSAGASATPSELHQALMTMSPYDGVSGPVTMQADRDALVDMVLGVFRNGRPEAIPGLTPQVNQ
jgi:branched-chain amino acid transport system substrate-binding protein